MIQNSKHLSNKNNLQVLHEDNHIIVVNKRAGDIVQGDKTGDKALSDVVKSYLKDKYNKPGNAYLGTVEHGGNYMWAVASVVSATAPLFMIVMFFQRQLISGLTTGAVKG